MTTRHCILGNSHTAAYKTGWDDIATKHPDHEIAFFAAPGASLANLSLSGRRLVTDDEQTLRFLRVVADGQETIDLDVFDHVWLVGLGLSIRRSEWLYRRCRARHLSLGDRQIIISKTAYDISVEGLFSESAAASVGRSLHDAGVQMSFIGAPRPGDSGARRSDDWSSFMERPSDEHQEVSDIFETAAAAVASSCGADFLTQPADTLASPVTTDDTHIEGSSRLDDRSHDGEEFLHANARYGTRMLEQFILA